MIATHDANLQELAGLIRALKEQMDAHERGPAPWVTYTDRVATLEDQVKQLTHLMEGHSHTIDKACYRVVTRT